MPVAPTTSTNCDHQKTKNKSTPYTLYVSQLDNNLYFKKKKRKKCVNKWKKYKKQTKKMSADIVKCHEGSKIFPRWNHYFMISP